MAKKTKKSQRITKAIIKTGLAVNMLLMAFILAQAALLGRNGGYAAKRPTTNQTQDTSEVDAGKQQTITATEPKPATHELKPLPKAANTVEQSKKPKTEPRKRERKPRQETKRADGQKEQRITRLATPKTMKTIHGTILNAPSGVSVFIPRNTKVYVTGFLNDKAWISSKHGNPDGFIDRDALAAE